MQLCESVCTRTFICVRVSARAPVCKQVEKADTIMPKGAELRSYILACLALYKGRGGEGQHIWPCTGGCLLRAKVQDDPPISKAPLKCVPRQKGREVIRKDKEGREREREGRERGRERERGERERGREREREREREGGRERVGS